MVQLQRSSGGGDIRNDLLHFVESLLREDIQISFTFQESLRETVIFVGATLTRWCDGSGGGVSTVNAERSAEQAQAPDPRKRAVLEHSIVPTTKLLIRFETGTGGSCPAVVFNFGHEERAAVCIEYDEKVLEVDCIPRHTVTERTLQRNEEIERVSKTVAEEPVVRPVVATFEWLVLVAADLEDPE